MGIDNHNDYYDTGLKEARLERVSGMSGYEHERLDIAASPAMDQLFTKWRPDFVVHLAAQAGVRYGLENPHAYVDSNLIGFTNILEGCRGAKVRHLVYASSSSVYGANSPAPFSERERADQPLSLYAATKRANELMAHSYSHQFQIPTTGLRFFTVYGPWGRPDMALFKFARAILEGSKIQLHNYGRHSRDFTYIDDVVEGLIRVIQRPPPLNGSSPASGSTLNSEPFRVLNIGNSRPVELSDYLATLEKFLGQKE